MIRKRLIKTTSLAVLLTVMTIVSSIQPVLAKDTSNDTTYITKNLITGIETSNKITESTNGEGQVALDNDVTTSAQVKGLSTPYKIVFNPDERVKVDDTTTDPYNAICYLQATFPDNYVSGSTAWIYKRDVAVTCGHCVYDDEHGGLAKTVTVWPGMKGNYAPYGSASSKSITVSSKWQNRADSDYDWAVIKLDSNIGQKCGKLSSVSDLEYDVKKNSELTIAGYPKPDDNFRQMYKSSGYKTGYDSNNIFYEIDTDKGESGSPILVQGHNSSHSWWTVIGMNKGYIENYNKNSAVRISSELRDLLDYVYEH